MESCSLLDQYFEDDQCKEWVECPEEYLVLDREINHCVRKKQKMPKYGLIMIMLLTMTGHMVYVCLGDKYFCIEPGRRQLGPNG